MPGRPRWRTIKIYLYQLCRVVKLNSEIKENGFCQKKLKKKIKNFHFQTFSPFIHVLKWPDTLKILWCSDKKLKCYAYSTMRKFSTITTNLKKIQKINQSSETPLEFCRHLHFSLKNINFPYILGNKDINCT